MAKLQEVPTDELLSFQDFPAVHSAGNSPNTSAELNLTMPEDQYRYEETSPRQEPGLNDSNQNVSVAKSFWTLEYYQQFFDVDTRDVVDRIIASVTPKRDNSLKHHLRDKPDLYGPFWISVTLIFTIAVSGNIASYLQQANTQYHWKYNFHLVSYAATAIYIYVLFVPFVLWLLLKYTSEKGDLESLDEGATAAPSALEIICVYGYSLFIYIPASILWSIQINFLQWLLVLVAALVSGSVLLLTLMPALSLSRHKFFVLLGIITCHILLAAGFMLYFFHKPDHAIIVEQIISKQVNATTIVEHAAV